MKVINREYVIINLVILILIIFFSYNCKQREKSLNEKIRKVNERIRSDSLNIGHYFERISLLKKINYTVDGINPSEQIEKDLYKILGIDSLNYFAYWNLADNYSSKRDYEKAIKSYASALEINIPCKEHIAAIHYQLGNLYCELDNFNEALVNYKKAMHISPNKFLYHSMGRCNLFLLNYSDALKNFEEELKMCEYDQDTIDCLSNILHILSTTGKEKEALQYLLVHKNSFYMYQSKLNYFAGILYSRLFDSKSAMLEFDKVINQSKDTTYRANAFFYISVLSAISGNQKGAKEYLKKACELGFYDVDLLEDWKPYISNKLYSDLKITASLNQTEEAKSMNQKIMEIIQKSSFGYLEKQRNYEISVRRIPLIIIEPRKKEEYRAILKSIPDYR